VIVAPFLVVRVGLAYRFLPPFFFPPLAIFLAIVCCPSLRRGVVRRLSSATRHRGLSARPIHAQRRRSLQMLPASATTKKGADLLVAPFELIAATERSRDRFRESYSRKTQIMDELKTLSSTKWSVSQKLSRAVPRVSGQNAVVFDSCFSA
jgi:hypothetical protein